MRSCYIYSATWHRLKKQGTISYDGNCIMGTAVPPDDCVLKDQLQPLSNKNTLLYSFKLTGDLQHASCSVLRIANSLQIKGLKKSDPPAPLLNLHVQSGHLCLAIREFKYPARWCRETQSYSLQPVYQQGHELFPVKCDHWIDLEIEMKWSHSNLGFIRCNDLIFPNLHTKFNHYPCELSLGILSSSIPLQNTIREYDICHELVS
jgi:hypothetical protein